MAKKQNNSQVLKGLLDALVLEVLSTKDSYGFEIYQTITERMQDDAGLFRESTLYPLLHRMEKKGLVAPYWKPGNRGTDRKYYKITKTGEEQLNERVENWLKVVRVLERTILKPKDQKDEHRSNN